MENETSQQHRRRTGIALAAAGLLAGGAAAAVLGVAAANATTTTATTTAIVRPATEGAPSAGYGPGGSGGRMGRGDETVVTGAKAATLRAEALKAVPGGSVDRVETDAGDGAYEAHMTKSDGTRVTVKFDSALKVIGVEAGMGKGDPAPSGTSGSGSQQG